MFGVAEDDDFGFGELFAELGDVFELAGLDDFLDEVLGLFLHLGRGVFAEGIVRLHDGVVAEGGGLYL